MDPEPVVLRDAEDSRYDPRSYDSPLVRALALPVVGGLAILLRQGPLGFLFEGFHVWLHELGHASVAWLTSRPAVPLPLGWTNVEPGQSKALYGVFLAAFIALGVVGWRERKLWPMVLAPVLVGVQTTMTWWLPADQARQWMIFGGVGGEFYLAAALISLFFFEFPERFRWGTCRYVALFIASASFSESYAFWKSVKRGVEGIPYGSMINGEDDGGGDMNILAGEYHWSQHRIIGTYNHLADGCLLAIALVYLFFNLRLNRLFNPLIARVMMSGLGEEPGP